MLVTSSGIPRSPHIWPTGYKSWGFSRSPIRFDHLLEWLTELRKVLYLQLDTNQDQLDEETHKMRTGSVPNAELLCPLSRESECVILLASQCVHQPRSSTKLWCPELLLGFYYVGTINWVIGHIIELNIQPLFSLPRGLEVGLISCGSKPQPSNHMVGLSGMAYPHPESSR